MTPWSNSAKVEHVNVDVFCLTNMFYALTSG